MPSSLAVHRALWRPLWAVLFLLLGCGSVSAVDLTWTRVLVEARLDDDGVLNVREHLDVTVHRDFQTLQRVLSAGPQQDLRLQGVFRIDATGQAHPLSPGDLSRADQYADHGVAVDWSLRHADAPAKPAGAVRYRIDYELRGAMVPAWDIPHSTRPYEVIDTSFINPMERWEEVRPVWEEARACMARCYRLDHDVHFPNRDWANAQLIELSYQLHYGRAWRLLAPDRELAIVTPDVNYRIQRSFEYLPSGAPAAVDRQAALVRMATLPGLLVGGLLLWLVFGLSEAWLRWRSRLSREGFAEMAAAHPPEWVHLLIRGTPAPRAPEQILDRWLAQGVISVRRLAPTALDARPELAMTLVARREALHPVDQAIAELIFGSKREVTSAEVREATEWDATTLEMAFADALRSHAGKVPRRRVHQGRTGWRIVAGALGLAGVVAGMSATMQTGSFPFGVLAGVLAGGGIAVLPARWWHGGRSLAWLPVWWLALLPGLGLFAAAMLMPAVPLAPLAAAGMALLALAGYALLFSGTLAPTGTPEASWWQARGWAGRQLRRVAPDLDDAWIAHLEALGLGPALQRWRDRRQIAAMQGLDASMAGLHRAFTGNPVPVPARDWDWVIQLAYNAAYDDKQGEWDDDEDDPEDDSDDAASGYDALSPRTAQP